MPNIPLGCRRCQAAKDAPVEEGAGWTCKKKILRQYKEDKKIDGLFYYLNRDLQDIRVSKYLS